MTTEPGAWVVEQGPEADLPSERSPCPGHDPRVLRAAQPQGRARAAAPGLGGPTGSALPQAPGPRAATGHPGLVPHCSAGHSGSESGQPECHDVQPGGPRSPSPS